MDGALRELGLRNDRHTRDRQILLFVDAARRQSGTALDDGGDAVVYRPPATNSGEFFVRPVPVNQMPAIEHGEMLGIAEALFVALEYANRSARRTVVKIFTDSLACLQLLGCRNVAAMWAEEMFGMDKDMEKIVEAVIWASRELRHLRWHVEVYWIPGHDHNVYPHCVTDMASRDMYTGMSDAEELLHQFYRNYWGQDAARWEDLLLPRLNSVMTVADDGKVGLSGRDICRRQRERGQTETPRC